MKRLTQKWKWFIIQSSSRKSDERWQEIQNLILWTPLPTLSTFTCSKLTVETLEQGVKYVQS